MKNCFEKNRFTNAIVIFFITFLTLIIYSHTLNSPFVFDDIDGIANNPKIKNLSNFLEAPDSRYLAILSFALNYRFGGLNPSGYHLINIIIHIINGILVYALVKLTFKTPQMQQCQLNNSKTVIFISFAASIIFVSHPIQTQAVTYTFQRFASLTALFYLSAMVLYIKAKLCLLNLLPVYGQKSLSMSPGNSQFATCKSFLNLKHIIFYILCLISIVFAMKTKEISFTLPFIIILCEFTFFTYPKDASILTFFYLFPFLAAIFIIPMGKIFVLEGINAVNTAPLSLSRWRYLTSVPGSLSRMEYLFTQFRVIITYIRLLFVPFNQNLDYDYPVYYSFFKLEVFASFFILLSIFAIAISLYISRSKSFLKKYMAFGLFWFFITISIESSIIPLKEIIHEHRLYLPSVGAIMTFTSAIFYGVGQLRKRYRYFMLAVIVILFSVAAYKRNLVWGSEKLLWKDAVAKSPNKARPYLGLGNAYRNSGNYPKAITNYSMAIKLDPEFEKAYTNRGNVYDSLGKHQQAIADYTRAIKYNPGYADAYYNRGFTYTALGKHKQAIADYTYAIELNPEYADAYNNRGIIYGSMGNYRQAIVDYSRAIELNPEYADAYNNRGVAYGSLDNLQQAIADFNKAIKLNAQHANAYNNLGEVYTKLGNTEQALKFYKKAVSLGLK